MNVLSLFDGVSCGQQALKELGIPIDEYYASEIDKYAISVTQYNFPDTVQLGDVKKWKEWDIDWGSIDLIQFGNPCQSFSIAGKRKGLNDNRGELIHTVFEILEKTQVEVFLMENVKGLINHDGGKTFEYILSMFNKCGYAVDWIVINATKLSAQNRERVYVIGKRLDKCQGSVYNIDHDRQKNKYKKSTNKSIGGFIQEGIFLSEDCKNV